MENKKRSLAVISTIFSIIVGLIMVLIFSHYLIDKNIHLVEEKTMEGNVVTLDYEEEVIEDDDAPVGVKRICTLDSGDIADGGESLSFFAVHQFVDVYIDDQLVYSLKKSDDCTLGKTAGTNWVNVIMDDGQSNKEVKVVLTPVYKSSVESDMRFVKGPEDEVIIKQLKSDLLPVMLSILAVFAGIVFIIMTAFSFRNNKAGSHLTAIGLFAMMIGIWRFTDAGITTIIWSERTILLSYTAIGMLMFISVPIVKGMKNYFDESVHKILDSATIVSTAVALVQLMLQGFNIYDVRETLVVTHVVIVLNCVICFGCFVYEKVKIQKKGSPGIGRILFVLCAVGGLLDLTLFYVREDSYGLVFTILAFLVYIMVAGLEVVFDHFRRENQLLEKEVEMAESRIGLMVSQIQPHFLYNAITSIMAICMKDSNKAVEALADFADYLRGNLDSLQNEKKVMFSKELKHIESYLRLEKMRFQDKLEIVYDIDVLDFLLPTLAVQPLVENAVKHGIGQKEDGGTVKLITREMGDHILIVVEDTGVGFDTSVKKDDGRSHIGLENVQYRIEQISGGTMAVDSVPGEGTSIALVLPKESE